MPLHVRLASSCHKVMVVVVAKDAIASTVGSNVVCVYRFRIVKFNKTINQICNESNKVEAKIDLL